MIEQFADQGVESTPSVETEEATVAPAANALEAATDAAIAQKIKSPRAVKIALTSPAKSPKNGKATVTVVREKASGAAQRAAGVTKSETAPKAEAKAPSPKEQRADLADSLETIAATQVDLGHRMSKVLEGYAKALRQGKPITEEQHTLAYNALCAGGRTRIATVKRAVLASRAK